ncbi:MAG: NAD(P)H-quinone oxidoreductase [Propionibacteriaceae bacterium]
MHAITVSEPGDPDVLTWSQVADPAVSDGELLIEVTAAGVNRADLMQRQGHYPPPPGASPIIGLECSGQVVAVGAAVTGVEIGQQVVALLAGGGYAERVAVPAGQVLPLPHGIDPVTAAGLMEVAATVLSNFDLAKLTAGQRFLVHGGSGGIGSFAIQYAKQLGANVLTTAGNQDKLAYCRDLGADVALDYHRDWAEGVQKATDGCGVDVILDNMGAKYLHDNLDSLALDGRLMIIGLQGGRSATIDLGAMLTRRTAVFSTSLRARPVDQKAAICARVREAVWPLLAGATIRPTRHQTLPMPEAADAHRQLESGDTLGKIILVR